jgi:hypothetical protein
LVPIRIETERGDRHENVRLTDRQGTLTLTLPSRLTAIAVDPDYRLYRHLAPGEASPIMRDVTLEPDAHVVVANADSSWSSAATSLAERLLDSSGTVPSSLDAIPADAPILLIGAEDHVASLLTGLGIAQPAIDALGRGNAQVWTVRDKGGRPVMVVTGQDAKAIDALARPLPHYGNWGFAVFENGRMLERGYAPGAAQHDLRRVLTDGE